MHNVDDAEVEADSITDRIMFKTYGEVSEVLNEVARSRGHYAGFPIPIEGESLVLHPNEAEYKKQVYAAQAAINKVEGEANTEISIRNSWFNRKHGVHVVLFLENGIAKVAYHKPDPIWLRDLRTVGIASSIWTAQQEQKAIELLATLVSEHQLRCYLTTGTFLETSKRSGVIYLFRKLRPTIALSTYNQDACKPICSLCMHPLAHYVSTHAGAMCPTDDVISHLVMMRGDEHRFWKVSNHHYEGQVSAIL